MQVQTKTVERSYGYHTVSYILTITNNTDREMAGSATIQWLDAEGFILEEDFIDAPKLAPGDNIFRGSVMIEDSLAIKVTRTVAEVTAL